MRTLALAALSFFALTNSAHAAGAWDGTWTGKYLCGQGATGLTLILTETGPSQLEGEFRFSALPENPTVPSGAFRVQGALQGSGNVALYGQSWIKQPPGYGMVSMQGRIQGDTISGNVLFPGCTSFTVSRAKTSAALVSKPQPAKPKTTNGPQ